MFFCLCCRKHPEPSWAQRGRSASVLPWARGCIEVCHCCSVGLKGGSCPAGSPRDCCAEPDLKAGIVLMRTASCRGCWAAGISPDSSSQPSAQCCFGPQQVSVHLLPLFLPPKACFVQAQSLRFMWSCPSTQQPRTERIPERIWQLEGGVLSYGRLPGSDRAAPHANIRHSNMTSVPQPAQL